MRKLLLLALAVVTTIAAGWPVAPRGAGSGAAVAASLTFVVKDAGGVNPPIGGATVTVVQGAKPPIIVDGTNAAGEAQFASLTAGTIKIKSTRFTYVDLEQTETLKTGDNTLEGFMTRMNGSPDYFTSAGDHLARYTVERWKNTPGEGQDQLIQLWHSFTTLDESDKAWVAKGMAKTDSAKTVLMKDTSFAAAVSKGGAFD
jgi:hypothetical protein